MSDVCELFKTPDEDSHDHTYLKWLTERHMLDHVRDDTATDFESHATNDPTTLRTKMTGADVRTRKLSTPDHTAARQLRRSTVAISSPEVEREAHHNRLAHAATSSALAPNGGRKASLPPLQPGHPSLRPPRTPDRWEDPVVGFHDKISSDHSAENRHPKHILAHTSETHHRADEHVATRATTPDFETPASGHTFGEMIESKYVEEICEQLRMSKRDVWKLRKQFNDIDVDGTNTITMEEFFFLVQVERCGLSKTILRLADVPPDTTRLTFDQYLCCVCQFASFSEPELLHFVFALYMSDRHRGVMVEQDVLALTQVLMTTRSSYKGNIRQASQRLNLTGSMRTSSQLGVDVTYSLDDLQQLARHNPVAFYPLLSMQRNVRRTTLGERYWVRKVDEANQIDAIVHYMECHSGLTPPLPWRERVWAAICWPKDTNAMRLRRQAEQKYLSN